MPASRWAPTWLTHTHPDGVPSEGTLPARHRSLHRPRVLLESVGCGWALGRGHQGGELAEGVGPGHSGSDPTVVTLRLSDSIRAR